VTTLLVQELKTGEVLEQQFRISDYQRTTVGSISPYLYFHDAPAGTFTVELVGLRAWSFDFTDVQAETAVEDYCHVYFPLIPVTPLHLEVGIYTLRLSASGYALGPSWAGWIQQHENLDNLLDYVPTNDGSNPLAIRIKEMRRRTVD